MLIAREYSTEAGSQIARRGAIFCVWGGMFGQLATAPIFASASEYPVTELSQHELIRDASAIVEIGKRIAASGQFAMDLEFMSADRYIPDLALVQLAWQEEGELQMVLVEGVDTELGPIFEQVESDSVLLLAHGAKQDLSLLSMRYGVRAGAFMDTQIAAAFAGIAEQIGYANLVDALLGKRLDKGSQFTDWMRRPLSEKQLRYALDDVRYLGPVWEELRARLDRHQRRPWAEEESGVMAASAADRRPASDAYKSIGGAASLKGPSLGALQALAAWRDDVAVSDNIPPSWIIADGPAVEACRRKTRSEQDLKKLRGIGTSTVKKYGERILEAISRGRSNTVDVPPKKTSLPPIGQAQAAVVTAMVTGRATDIGVAPRAIATKSDAEALVRHAQGESVECKLLQGWRGEVVGTLAMRWLQGDATVIADPKLGVRVQFDDGE
jgi:ribonuclease D